MIALDYRTVFIGHTLSTVLCAIVMTTLWARNRTQSVGIGFWAAHMWLQVFSLVLILLRGAIPDFLSMVVSNTLLLGGLLLLLIGLERYFDRVGTHVHNYVALAIFAAVQTYFAVVQPSLMARNINIAVGFVFLCSQVFWLLRHRVDRAARQATIGATVVFGAYVVISVLRIVVELVVPEASDLFHSGIFESVILLSYQLLQLGLTFALVLIVNTRLRTSLQLDIAQREAAEQALSLSERKYSTAFHTSPDSVNINRLSDGLFLDANEGFVSLTGYTIADVMGRTSRDINIWADPADRERLVLGLQSDGVVYNLEAQFRRKDGSTTTALMSAQVIDVEGERCILSVTRDISDRKDAEREILRLNAELEERVQERTEELTATNEELLDSNARLEEATRAKSDFLAAMSHELRTPLNSIIGFSDILARGMAGPLEPEQEKQVRMVHSSGKHLLHLVNEVLDLSAIEAGRTTIEWGAVDVSNVVSAVVDSLEPLAAEKGLTLSWQVDAGVASIVSDRTRLEQVLFNLLGNAIKFTDAGTVSIDVRRDADVAVISLSDTGRGIAGEDLPRVFDEFYQAQRRDVAKSEGTGLGLTVSKRLVTMLGGSIDAASEVGKGSTFVVRLPLADADPDA